MSDTKSIAASQSGLRSRRKPGPKAPPVQPIAGPYHAREAEPGVWEVIAESGHAVLWCNGEPAFDPDEVPALDEEWALKAGADPNDPDPDVPWDAVEGEGPEWASPEVVEATARHFAHAGTVMPALVAGLEELCGELEGAALHQARTLLRLARGN